MLRLSLQSERAVTTFERFINRNTQWYLDAVADGSILVPHAFMTFFLPEAAASEMLNYLTNNSDASLGATDIPVFPMFTPNFKRVLQKMPAGDLAFQIRVYRKAVQEG